MADARESNPNSFHAPLAFLAELSQVVASTTELQAILDWVVQRIAGLLLADEASIRLLGADPIGPPRTVARRPLPGLESGSWEQPVSTSVMGYLLARREVLNTPDLLADERFRGLENIRTRVRAVLAAPLRVESQITGMLAVTNRSPGRVWSPEEVQLLSIVASHSSEAIEKARLRDAALARAPIDRDYEQALVYQRLLVPAGPLVAGHWEVDGRVIPALQVGGDYFDYFPLGSDRFGVTIADVSGKGLAAAILMSNVQASLRAFCDGEREISDAIARVNRNLARHIRANKFVTLFYGEVDTRRHVLRYSNAGHNCPLLLRSNGALEELGVGGPVLGPFEDARYDSAQVAFVPGDGLLLYSDGISEEFDAHGRMFGDEQLQNLWRESGGRRPAAVLERLMREVERFRGSEAQSDDMTAVVLGPQTATSEA